MEIYMIDLFSRNMVSFPWNYVQIYLLFWCNGWIYNGIR